MPVMKRRGYDAKSGRPYKRPYNRPSRVSRFGLRSAAPFKVKRMQQAVLGVASLANQNILNALPFRLSDLPGYTELTGLFDEYELYGIRYRFYVDLITNDNNGPSGTVPPANAHFPRVWHMQDHTDSTIPTFDDLKRDSTTVVDVLTPAKPFSKWYWLKPKFQTEQYVSAISTGYSPKTGYISTATPNVPHYGIKWAVNDMQVDQTAFLQVYYYLRFRHPK